MCVYIYNPKTRELVYGAKFWWSWPVCQYMPSRRENQLSCFWSLVKTFLFFPCSWEHLCFMLLSLSWPMLGILCTFYVSILLNAVSSALSLLMGFLSSILIPFVFCLLVCEAVCRHHHHHRVVHRLLLSVCGFSGEGTGLMGHGWCCCCYPHQQILC